MSYRDDCVGNGGVEGGVGCSVQGGGGVSGG